MTLAIALLTFFLLITVAFAHLMWALGTTWPLRDEVLLAQTVVGRPGITRMPHRLATLMVAVLATAASVIAVGLADPVEGGASRTGIGLFLALVFAARGVAGYTAFWRRRFPTQPFASYDRALYSPGCFLIAAGYLALSLMRLT